MSILSGFFKTKRYRKTTDGYKLESNWTSGNTVELDDGNTVQNNLGAIKGITTSTSVKEEGYAADATTVAALNNSLEVTTCNFSNKSGRGNPISNCKKVGKLLFVNLVFAKGENAPIDFGEFIGIVANGRNYLNGYLTDESTNIAQRCLYVEDNTNKLKTTEHYLTAGFSMVVTGVIVCK